MGPWIALAWIAACGGGGGGAPDPSTNYLGDWTYKAGSTYTIKVCGNTPEQVNDVSGNTITIAKATATSSALSLTLNGGGGACTIAFDGGGANGYTAAAGQTSCSGGKTTSGSIVTSDGKLLTFALGLSYMQSNGTGGMITCDSAFAATASK